MIVIPQNFPSAIMLENVKLSNGNVRLYLADRNTYSSPHIVYKKKCKQNLKCPFSEKLFSYYMIVTI